jgi:tape measure domain-containing protein
VASFFIDIVLRARGANQQIVQTEKSLRSLENRAGSVAAKLNRLFRIGGASIMLAGLVGTIDTYTTLQNKVGAVTSTMGEQKAVMAEVFAVANRARVPVEAVGTAYQRLRNATLSLGLTQRDTLAMTETLSKGMLIYGATQAEAASTITQFTQALQKGKLDGDEFRSVMENSPPIVKLLAKELKVTKGELFQMSKTGKVTAKVMAAALINGSAEINKQFAKLTPTISQSLTVLQNKFTQFMGELAHSSGFARGLTAALALVAKHFDIIGNVAMAASYALSVVFVGKGIRLAIKGLYMLRAAAMANPFTAIIMGIIFLVALLVQFDARISSVGSGTVRFRKIVEVSWEKIKKAIGSVLTSIGNAIETVFTFFYEEFKDLKVGFGDILVFIAIFVDKFVFLIEALAQTVVAIFVGIPVAIGVVLVKGFGYLLKGLEKVLNAVISAYNKIAKYVPGISTIGKASLGSSAVLGVGDDMQDIIKAAADAAKDSWSKVTSSTIVGPAEKAMKDILWESIEGGTARVDELGRKGKKTFDGMADGAKKTKDEFEQMVERLYPAIKAMDDLKDAKRIVDAELAKAPKTNVMSLADGLAAIQSLNSALASGQIDANLYAQEMQRIADVMKRGKQSRIVEEDGLRLLDRQRYLLMETADAIGHYVYQAGEADAQANVLYAIRNQLPSVFNAEVAAREKLNELVEKGVILSEYELKARRDRGLSTAAEEAAIDAEIARLAVAANVQQLAAEMVDKATEANKRLAKRIEENTPIQQRYAEMIQEVNDQFDLGSLTVDQYHNALREVDKDFGFKDIHAEKIAQMREEIDELTSGLTLLDSAFQALNDQIVSAVTKGEASLQEFVDSLLESLTRIILKIIETWITMKLLESLGPNFTNTQNPGMNMLSGLGGMLGGIANLWGFAHGGQFRVGGQPGRDQNLVAFRASRGEEVTVRTPAQQKADRRAGRGGEGPPPIVNLQVVNRMEPGQVVPVMDSRAGRRAVYNSMRFAPRAVSRMR